MVKYYFELKKIYQNIKKVVKSLTKSIDKIQDKIEETKKKLNNLISNYSEDDFGNNDYINKLNNNNNLKSILKLKVEYENAKKELSSAIYARGC